jgi:hypothetical protein
MFPAFHPRKMRQSRKWAMAFSAITLVAYFACIFGHGLSDAIALSFSDHGHHVEFVDNESGEMRVIWVHEAKVNSDDLREHVEKVRPIGEHHHHDRLLCQNGAAIVSFSSYHGQIPTIKALIANRLLIPASPLIVARYGVAAIFASHDAKLRRLNSVLLRV